MRMTTSRRCDSRGRLNDNDDGGVVVMSGFSALRLLTTKERAREIFGMSHNVNITTNA